MTATDTPDRISQAQREAFARNHAWNLEHYGRDAAEHAGLTRTGRRRAPVEPVAPVTLAVGDQVKFHRSRRWWLVRAVGQGHVVLTATREFDPGRELSYTIISWAEGRRGPHGSYGHWPVDTDEQCDAIAAAMDAADHEGGRYGFDRLELSERRSIRLDIADVRRRRVLLRYVHTDGREGVVAGRLIERDGAPVWEIRSPEDWWVFGDGWTRAGLAARAAGRRSPAPAEVTAL